MWSFHLHEELRNKLYLPLWWQPKNNKLMDELWNQFNFDLANPFRDQLKKEFGK